MSDAGNIGFIGDLEALLRRHARADGVWMPSSTWAILARKPG